jgi:parallel beta-helix repeat protein
MRYILFLFFLINSFTPSCATTYYVSSLIGKDSHPGTSEQFPFKTLQKAANIVVAGDTVLVMNGTYTNSDNEPGFFQSQILFFMRGGTPDAWITFMAMEGHQPKLIIQNAFGIRILSTKNFHPDGVLSYIRIKNLTVIGNATELTLCDALRQPKSCNQPQGEIDWKYNGSGISIGSEDQYAQNGEVTHHIEISNCEVHNCAAAGIGAYYSDWITITGNKVYNNSTRTSFGSSGIHIYNPRNSKITDSGTYRYVIERNEVFNNRIEVPFYDGKECKGFTDGNGIIIDDSRNTQSNKISYSYNFLIENNLIYENGGSGISIFHSDNVTLRNNTTYKNCQLTPDSNKRSELLLLQSSNIRIYNNIFYARENQYAYYKGSKCKRIDSYTNILYNGKKNSRLKKSVKDDPLFVQSTNSPKINVNCDDFVLEVIQQSVPADLRLQPQSQARGKANSIDLPFYDFTGKKIERNVKGCIGAFQ